MITVVNASFFGGDKDIKKIVNQPKYKGVEYVLYTNKPEIAKNTIWEVKNTQLKNTDPRLAARNVKINTHHFHPNSDYWLWVDSNMKIQVNPNILVQKYLDKFDACAMPHPERHNWVEEAKTILNYNMDTSETLNRALNKYLAEGCVPTQLWETGCLLRRNNQKVRDFNKIWWEEVKNNSIRDQISVHYASWKVGLYINSFPGTNSENDLRFKMKNYLPQWKEIIRDWN